MPRLPRLRALITVTLLAIVLSTVVPPAFDEPAEAADLSQFRPGNIISDTVFFNAATMTEGEVQAFLNSKVSSCSAGSTCLKNFRETTVTRAANAYCSEYQGAANESAARIIVRIAQACGINPQVLLVTLQKEQGLVTATAPTAARYRIAMGYGCPDTAPCDTLYYGFFNQVYSAARQFQVYRTRTDRYDPYRTVNIGYSPRLGCGGSNVYLENAATAGLYNYTPYQPNANALAAGYGSSTDPCAAYGNRNFYSYFTDWFGSTQHLTNTIVRAQNGVDLYLIAGGEKHYIPSLADYAELSRRLGAFSTVAQSYLDLLPTGKNATRYVHDPATGTLYLLQNGVRHRFANFEQIAQHGFAAESYVSLDQRQLAAFTRGGEVSRFVTIAGSDKVYLLTGLTKQHVAGAATFEYLSGGTRPFVATLSAAAGAALTTRPALIRPMTLVRESGSAEVYAATGPNTLIHIPSFATAQEFGMTNYSVVTPGTLAGLTVSPGSLGLFGRCGNQTYLATGGRLAPVTGSAPSGFTATELSAEVCTMIPKAPAIGASPFFLRANGSNQVLVLDQGTLRHVRSMATLLAMNGNRPLTISGVSAGTVAAVPAGPAVYADGEFVRFADSPDVYSVQNQQLRWVPTIHALLALTGGVLPTIQIVPADTRAFYRIGSPL